MLALYNVCRRSTEAGTAFLAFLREGTHHILIGYDHLAFLLSLLLPAALVRAHGAWRPVDRFRDAFMQALGIVTAFTAAHSITLSVLLVALDNVRPLIMRRV